MRSFIRDRLSQVVIGLLIATFVFSVLTIRHVNGEPTAPAPRVPTAISRLDLERAIARLPPGCRAAFVLHDVEGFEHEEIARQLKCTIGTSKSQLHKARMKLRALLDQKSSES